MQFEEFIKNKKVLLLGPASYFTSLVLEEDFTCYDTVVKLNKMVEKTVLATEALNNRNEILYHCLDINAKNGDLPYDIQKWIDRGVKHLRITHPPIIKHYIKNIHRFLEINKKYNIPFSVVEPDMFNAIKHNNNTSPNAGTIAIYDIMSKKPAELRIKGMTFCKTPYGTGYKEAAFFKNKKTRRNPHNHDNQLKVFSNFYELNKNTIRLDDELIEILERYK